MPPFAPIPRTDRDRIVVNAAPDQALDLLRLAVLRSDDVLLVAETVGATAQRFASRFAVEVARRPLTDADLDQASAVLVSLADPEDENRVVRHARRRGVPVHVVGRPLVSDFTMLGMLEHPGLSLIAA